MMKLSLGLLLSLFLLACAGDQQTTSSDAFIIDHDNLIYGADVTIQFQLIDKVDSIRLSLNGASIAVVEAGKGIVIGNEKFNLGTNQLSADLYRAETMLTITDSLQIYPPAPKQYTFKVINQFDHDTLAYTQGLEFYKGSLYESTGAAEGFISSIRKIDWERAEIMQKKEYIGNDLAGQAYFMEGLTFVKDKLVLLTYLNGYGLVLEPDTFREKAKFTYGKSREGWGICFDGEKLIKSDGSSFLYFLDANSYEEIAVLLVYDNRGLIDKLVLNELEYVNGKLYVNYYGRDELLIIDPKTGIVEGVVNCIGLHRSVAQPNKEMNGIAYNHATGNFFVTGKQWDKLYELKILER